MTMRRQRREDPAYLTAMREAKELFDAEMAKNSMKGRGRPKTVVTATPAAVATEVEIDHEGGDEIVDLSPDEVEEEEVEVEEVAPPKAGKSAAKPAAKPAAKSSGKAATRAVKKPAAKKKAAPAKKPAAKRR
jgi:hypothetical protein